MRRAEELLAARGDEGLGGDVETAIEVLEPLVTEERRARLQAVIAQRLDSVTVRWPSGKEFTWKDVAADQILRLDEHRP